jgi:ubiquinone biosynthesis protein UbiJ
MLQPAMAQKRDNRDEIDDPEGIGGIVDEIASSWLFGDALTRIVETGEKAFRAQQTALSALGLPSGSQFESLTLRVRTIFHRIEELEDELDRISARVTALEKKAAPKPSAKRTK